MDSEQDLLDALERVIHEDFPNPQRMDCPGLRGPVETCGRIRTRSTDSPSRPCPAVRSLLRRPETIAQQGAESSSARNVKFAWPEEVRQYRRKVVGRQ